MKITEDTSQKIKNMSIICALLVVAIHVTWPYDGGPSFTWFIHHVVQEGVAKIAVPFFFVVSGFFLSLHMDEEGWFDGEVCKRLHSLVVPFFVWIIIATIFVAPMQIVLDIIAHRPFGFLPHFSNGRWVATLGLDPRCGPSYCGVLWYVRCLFCFVLIAPVFKWLVLKGGVVWLVCAFLVSFLHMTLSPFPPFLQKSLEFGFSLSGVFYFSLGIYIGLSKAPRCPRWLLVPCALGGLGLLVISVMASTKGGHDGLVTLANPLLMYATWSLMPTSKWPKAVTSLSFPVFLLHVPILLYLAPFMKYTPLGGSQFESVVVFLGTLALSVLVIVVVKRFPRINVLLFAGRS